MSSDAQRTSTDVKRPLEWMRFDPVKFGLLIDDLNHAEVGAVTKVMLHLWQRGPMTESEVRRIARASFDAVRERMVEIPEGLSFEMVEEARERGVRAQNQRSKAGKASAQKRNERSTDVEHPLNIRSTDVLSISKSVSEENSEKERARDSVLDAFWKAYPEKKGKGAALKAWAKMTTAERAACLPAINAQIAANHFRGVDGKDYIPHPATWLNQRRWEDEIKTTDQPRPRATGWLTPTRA